MESAKYFKKYFFHKKYIAFLMKNGIKKNNKFLEKIIPKKCYTNRGSVSI